MTERSSTTANADDTGVNSTARGKTASALVGLVRLLARHAAREYLAKLKETEE